MKNYYLYFFLFLLSTSFLACSNQDSTSTTQSDTTELNIPTLLDRHADLRYDKEWDFVQNTYGKNVAKLRAKSNALEPRLELAQLFANEARITGEHGHYYPAALQMLDEILSQDINDKDLSFRALAHKASIQLSLHHFAEALQTGEKAVAMNPYNSFVYGVLVDAHVELGQYKKAVEMADKMISIRPDLRSYARVSYLREIHGDVDGAIEAMKLAVTAGYPGMEQTAWTRLTLGETYQKYGQLQKAEQEYQLALAERPDYPFAIAALGDIAYERGDYAKAEELWKKAGAIIPEFGFFESLAHLYKKQNRTPELEDTKAMILEMLADDIANGHNMNLEYANLFSKLFEDYDKALEYTRIEYEKRPDNIDVNRMLATYYQAIGQMDKAAKHYEVASRTNSKHPDLKVLQQQLASL